MVMTKHSGWLGIFLLAASLSAENLIWNSGFELGCGNWEGNTIMEVIFCFYYTRPTAVLKTTPSCFRKGALLSPSSIRPRRIN